jgi:ABC-type antimicrobial peptide transport system permease subunit
VAGTIGALALGRTVSTLLFGVSPTDLAAFGIAFATAVVAATAACLIPARRAASMDPLEGLRQ